MKEFIDTLRNDGYILKSLEKIDKKELGTRKNIDFYVGIDLKSFYVLVLQVHQKSRFVVKNANEVEEFFEKIKGLKEHNIVKKVLYLNSPLCSKAKRLLEEKNWKCN